MAKDVNELLGQIAAGGQGFEDIANAQKAQAMRDSMANLTQALPGMVKANDIGGILAGASAAGQGDILKEYIKGLMAQQSRAGEMITPEQGQALGLPTSISTVVGTAKNPKQQAKMLETYHKTTGEKLAATESGRRAKTAEIAGLPKIGEDLNKIDESYNKDLSNLSGIRSSLKQNTIPAQGAVAFFIGKAAQGGGVLTEEDLAPFKQKWFGGNTEAASNFFTGGAEGKMSKEHLAALSDLVDIFEKKLNLKHDMDSMTVLGNAPMIAPRAFLGDKPTEEANYVINEAKKRGIEWDQQKKTWIKKVPGGSSEAPLTFESAQSEIGKIPDAAKRAAAMQMLDKIKSSGGGVNKNMMITIKKLQGAPTP